MSTVLTLVAGTNGQHVSDEHIKQTADTLGRADLRYTCAPVWLAPEKAVDLGISNKPTVDLMIELRKALDAAGIDAMINTVEKRRKKILLADMDSTIVTGETLDELAEFAGLKDHVSAITQKAMEGKLDFHAALRERVALLKGLPEDTLQKTLDRTQITPGAEKMIEVMKNNGALCVLISGGFTFFTGRIANTVGFQHHHGNTLKIENGKLTGHVKEPILDKTAKLNYLKYYIEQMGLKAEHCMAIGDGANDLPMLLAAGLGVGFKPKDTVAAELHSVIRHGDLTSALYAQGYTAQHLK